ncbi:MAG: hypothetical protein AAF389_18845 [Gemmatimonadota bacterium]
MASTDRASRRGIGASVAVFFLGSIDAFSSGLVLLGSASALGGALNLAGLRWIDRYPEQVLLGLYGLNAMLATVEAVAAATAGKQGLPYAWTAAAGVYMVTGVRRARRRGRGEGASS